MKTAFAILILGFLIYACKPEIKKVTADAYFDVPAFFDLEAKRLSESDKQLTKTARVGKNQNSMRIKKPIWMQEFKLFRKANLNVPALLGKYTVTKDSSNERRIVTYRLPADQNGITELELTQLPSGRISKLHCRIFETSLLTTHTETWTFVVDSGYSYSGFDRINGITTNAYEISGSITTP